MKLNRKEQPTRRQIDKINFLKAKSYCLQNGTKVHFINQEDQSVIKLEISYAAGSIFQPKPMLASITNALLVEGSEKYTSSEIAEYFDNEGAFLETSCTLENASVILYCLAESLPLLLPQLKEIVSTPSFSEHEVKNHLMIQKQKFIVNNEKVGYVAKKEFLPFILGEKNAYSNRVEESYFENITRKDVIDFFQTRYNHQPFEIFVSGKVGEKSLEVIDTTFSNVKVDSLYSSKPFFEIDSSEQSTMLIEKEDAIQSAIRVGNVSIGRQHKDFPKLYLANTLLGGYFGSRLMNNIREDKGYTYGVGSGLISMKHLAYFVISTEVGSEVTNNTLYEIELEMNKMCDELVNEKELELVKNYVLGNIMRGFDGAFAAMDRFCMLNNAGLGYDYYLNLINTINKISAIEIRDVCREYLQFEKMKKVIVGKN